MAVNIETLSALERRFNLSIPADQIEKEVNSRLQRLSRTVKMSGFRPGKVPMKMMATTYGPQVRSEVLSDKIQQSFAETVTEQKLQVAGYPRIEPAKAEGAANDQQFEFTATFEVYPEVKVGDLAALAIEKPTAVVGDCLLYTSPSPRDS